MLRHNFLVNHISAFSFFLKCTLEERREIASYKNLIGNNDAIHFLCGGCDEQTISFLIKHGSNVNSVNDNLQSPLHIAIKSQNVRAVRGLIACGANVNMCYVDKMYHPVDGAIKRILKFGRKKVKPQADTVTILRMLVEAGSRKSGMPKIFERLESKEAIDLILDACSINDAVGMLRIAFNNLNVSLIESLAERGEFIGDVSFYSQAFIHSCILGNKYKTLERFLKLGYTPTPALSDNELQCIDPLLHAVRSRKRKFVDLLLAYDAVPNYPRVCYLQNLSTYIMISVFAIALERNIEIKWFGNVADYCTRYHLFRLMLLSNIGIGTRCEVQKRLGRRESLSRDEKLCLRLVNDERFPTLTDVINHQLLLRDQLTKIKSLRRYTS